MKFSVAVLLLIAKTSFANNYIDIYWRDYNGTVPTDAVRTGHSVYIAQVALAADTFFPGTLYPENSIGITEVKDKKFVFKISFKIMCTREQRRLRWEYVNIATVTGAFLNKCVVGGHGNNTPIYIGKIFHENEWKIGKVYPGGHKYQGLNIWKNNGDLYKPYDFKILRFD